MPSFSTSFEIEQKAADQKTVGRKDPNEGCLACPKCKSTWFEEVKTQQYLDDHTVILGQGVPPKNGALFVLLRCTKCQETLEPKLIRQSRDTVNNLYEAFLDSMKSDIKSEKL